MAEPLHQPCPKRLCPGKQTSINLVTTHSSTYACPVSKPLLQNEQTSPVGRSVRPGRRPPTRICRSAGGFLAIVGAEARLLDDPDGGPGTQAILNVARAYVAGDSTIPAPGSVAGPAWLIAVAVAHDGVIRAGRDTVALAGARPATVSYTGLASTILTGVVFGGHALQSAQTGPTGTTFCQCDPAATALIAGIWALAQPPGVGELLPELAHAGPVAAAAAGLIGLRDGLDALPRTWHRGLTHAPEALALAAQLTRTRSQRGLIPPQVLR